MYSMQCDVRFVNLLQYMNTFDLLILRGNYLLNHPCCLTNKMKDANLSVNDVSLCY